MFSRPLFLKSCHCENRDRPPVWLMRQAGRSIPEYRAVREKYDFLEMLTTDELIAEVSLQPWRRFGMDAVIVFSDILLLPWKMGMDLQFIEGQGPKFSNMLASEKELQNLKPFEPEEDMPFLTQALKNIREEIGNKAALLGFAGSPWTVASYIMEEGWRAPAERSNDILLKSVLERLTEETIIYLKAQIAAGVDAVQIFDSWGGILSAEDYVIWSAPYIKRIVSAIQSAGTPVILYVKDSAHLLNNMVATGCDVISIGWETSLRQARDICEKGTGDGRGGVSPTCSAEGVHPRAWQAPSQHIAIQGNFDPHVLMQATPKVIRAKTADMLKEMDGYAGYITNLGHGVLPRTPVENIAAFVETVKNLHI